MQRADGRRTAHSPTHAPRAHQQRYARIAAQLGRKRQGYEAGVSADEEAAQCRQRHLLAAVVTLGALYKGNITCMGASKLSQNPVASDSIYSTCECARACACVRA
jgi:hypothetical protein